MPFGYLCTKTNSKRMETVYLGIVAFLFALAIIDLTVGVSNDAVNFLSSAVGAKVAPFRTVLCIAAAGIICGALTSNGMMEIARHGIFRPEQFYFQELMCVFLAVMVTDVILLDIFNSLGLPTSTTVSMVFELLGGAFAVALVKIMGTDGMYFADYLNTEKALSVIMGIFLSVAIAFFFGALVQWLARLLFTFRSETRPKWVIGLFGGVAATAIVYFMLIKGAKDASFMTGDTKAWISSHTGLIIGSCMVGFSIIMQILHACRISVFKVIVLLGTFALALAFAGNDLVNFIGVPLAGYASYTDYVANANGSLEFTMDSLNGPARTPFIFLFAAGLVMIWSLFTSKKARKVIKTSVDLSRQDEGEEMFGSSAVARSIVRTSLTVATTVTRHTPPRMKRWLGTRFSQEGVQLPEGAAFDEVRASVNLLLASLLIALGTSLKLPLSTTYVTFMVAMGTSLADRAWGRESAVFRITGVLSVIGGWFITAGAAFTACFFVALAMYYGGTVVMLAMIALAVVLLVRSHILYRRKQEAKKEDELFHQILAESDKGRVWMLLRRHVDLALSDMLVHTSENYSLLTDGFIGEDRHVLHRVARSVEERKGLLKKIRRRELVGMHRIDRPLAIEKNMWLHLANNACLQLNYALKRLSDLCCEHVDNNFAALSRTCGTELRPIHQEVVSLLRGAEEIIRSDSWQELDELMDRSEKTKQSINELQKRQLARIQQAKGSLNTSLVYLNLLQESFEIVSTLRHLLRAVRNLHE